jgi:hypothetical protein
MLSASNQFSFNKHLAKSTLEAMRTQDFPFFGDFIPLSGGSIRRPLIAGPSSLDRLNERKVFVLQSTASGIAGLWRTLSAFPD